jgi:2-isopropylmalate synthase
VVTALVNIYKVNGNWNLSILPELTHLVGSFSSLLLKANQPIVGENAFTHKSGLHVKAVAKDPRSYEAISPETVNRKRKLIIDKYTGRSALKNKFNEIGVSLTKTDLAAVLKELKSHSEKVSWTGVELIYLTKSMGIKT